MYGSLISANAGNPYFERFRRTIVCSVDRWRYVEGRSRVSRVEDFRSCYCQQPSPFQRLRQNCSTADIFAAIVLTATSSVSARTEWSAHTIVQKPVEKLWHDVNPSVVAETQIRGE